ncbi:bifunctional DNA primase/polymerase, partial [Streptomyces formicae]
TSHRPVPRIPAARLVPQRARKAGLDAGGGRDQVQRTLVTVLEDFADCGRVAEGAGLSDRLNRAGYTLGGLVAAGYLSQDTTERVLLDTAAAARPGQETRAAQIVCSGLSPGLQRSLHPGRHP